MKTASRTESRGRVAVVVAVSTGILCLAIAAFAQTTAPAEPIRLAQFTADGKLVD